MIANIGDVVFVPHAYDMKFTPHMSAIEEIGEDGEYYCKVPILNMAGRLRSILRNTRNTTAIPKTTTKFVVINRN